MSELPTKETKRAFATEWAEADVRILRTGEKYALEIRALDDVGCHMHYKISIEEREAGELRGIWVET